ncbi:MAG: STAS domain-containing protein [Planctomycetota bacterium]
MQIDEQNQAAVTVLTPRGPLTGDDSAVLASRVDAAADQQRGRVVVDLSNVSFVDSAGLEVIADLGERFERVARSLKLACVNETLREVLDLTEVASFCELYEDASAAVRSFE